MSVATPIPAGWPPLPFTDYIEAELNFRLEGAAAGIPECCVDEFVSDVLDHGRFPGQLRGSLSGYVPCTRCRDRSGGE